MISAAAVFISWVMTVALPVSADAYFSGELRGTNACVSESRLPDNPDVPTVSAKAPLPELEAASFAILSDDGHVWLAEKEANTVQAMASITKLMTALVFLDHNPGWESEYEIKREDLVSGGRVHLFLGDRVRVKDLFNAALVASDNGAALALARSTALSDEEFVMAMNAKARSLGLLKTNFVDPIGLGDNNVAHAKDIARLAQVALSQQDIAKAVNQENYRFNTLQGRVKFLESTDWLLSNENNNKIKALGGKTGYTEAAGYSFVGRFQDENGRSVVVVVLDSGGRNERFLQAQALADWAFTYCQW